MLDLARPFDELSFSAAEIRFRHDLQVQAAIPCSARDRFGVPVGFDQNLLG
jgi:hypothetical protein